MKSNILVLGLLSLLVLSFAESVETSNLIDAFCKFSNTLKAILPSIVFVLIITAAVVYAAGQLLSAEMRSRASVWATSMIVGAVIAILIVLIVPMILDALFEGQGISPSKACEGITETL